jgi:hypothetical protein
MMAKETEENASLLGRQTAALEKLANAVTKYLESEDKSEDDSDKMPDDRSYKFTEESEDEDEGLEDGLKKKIEKDPVTK